MDATVSLETPYRITLFYGNPRVDRGQENWDLLRALSWRNNGTWMVYGDFNEILHPNEMQGSRSRNANQMRIFREALMDCRLLDIRSKSGSFTYSNKRKEIHETKVRLDRVIANKEWIDLFPDANVNHGFAKSFIIVPLYFLLTKFQGKDYKVISRIFILNQCGIEI